MSIKVASIGGVSGGGKAAVGAFPHFAMPRLGARARIGWFSMTTPEPELANQSPPYEGVNLFESDRPLRDAVASNAHSADAAALTAFGRRWGSAAMFERGRQANAYPPRLET